MRKAKALFFAAGLMFLSTSFAHADCTVTERLPWTKSGTEKLSIFAYSAGETCEGAVVGFLVVNSKGKAVWIYSKLGNEIAYFLDDAAIQKTIFAGPENEQKAKMKSTLHDWLDSELKTADSLPDWPKSKKDYLEPAEGDFGFHSAEGLRRTEYLDYRKRKVPLFCFYSGVESRTCIVADKNDSIVEIGGESIP